MRKFFCLLESLLCLIVVISCNKNKSESGPQCWEITKSYNGRTNIFYEWCTEDSVMSFSAAATAIGVATTYKKVDKNDENSCYAMYVERTWDDVAAEYPFIKSFPKYDYTMHNVNYLHSSFIGTIEQLYFSEQRCDKSHYTAYKQKLEESGFTQISVTSTNNYEEIIYELKKEDEELSADIAFTNNSFGCALHRTTD